MKTGGWLALGLCLGTLGCGDDESKGAPMGSGGTTPGSGGTASGGASSGGTTTGSGGMVPPAAAWAVAA